MRRPTDRSQTAVIGFVLMFALVILLLTVLQTTAVPTWNQGEEFDHSQQIRGEMELLQDDVATTAATGRVTSESLTLGLRYPRRPFLINPADPSGRIRTTDSGTVELANVTASGDAGDYWTGDTRTFQTRHVVYTPDYNEFDNPPTTVYENGVLYDRYPDRQLPLTTERLVNGRRITLVTINGSLSESATGTADIEIAPVSAPQQVTAVEGDGPVRLRLPTRMDQPTWRGLLEDELVANGGYVYDNITVTEGDPYDTVTITLDGTQTYNLRLAEVRLGSGRSDSGPHYLTVDSPPERDTVPGNPQRVVFEVRDRYNNPVSGVTVDADVLAGVGSVEPIDATTDEKGHATFRYTTSDPGSATVTATYGQSPGARQTANVSVQATGGSGGGDSDGPTVTVASPTDGQSIPGGQNFDLNVSASDFARGGTDIYAVEWWSNRTTPGGSVGAGTPVGPADGNFDTVEEWANQTVDTTGWSNGAHTISVRAQDANGNWGPVLNRTVVTPTGYAVQSVTATAGGGNDIDVTADLQTTDSGAQVEVQSLNNGAIEQTTGLVAVSASQPQTFTVKGANQADQVRVILYDASGTQQDSQTVPFP